MIAPRALAAVPGWDPDDCTARVAPLASGQLNRAFLVETRAGRFVLRLNARARATRALGIDRRAEIEAQTLAAGLGLAPRVITLAADQSFMVSEFVAGAAADAAELAQAEGLARLGATLQRLRTLVPPPRLQGPSLIERARRLVLLASRRAPGAAVRLAAARDAAEAGWLVAGGGRPACIVHSDPNPANVVLPAGAGPAVLLDWEYAHAGDPLQDAACWLRACPALHGREAALLHACGLSEVADATMLSGMAAVYGALDAAWICVAATAAGAAPDGRAN